jgi:hypothetical protein
MVVSSDPIGLHAPNSALSAADREGRPVGQATKSCREPEYIADQRSAASPGVGRHAQGSADPSALSILGLKLTSSMRGQ